MRPTRIRVRRMLTTAISIALAGAVKASAQTVDFAGAWTFTVTTTETGSTTPSVTFEQDGETLTGRYSSEGLGEADLSGTVSGSEITFTFSADLGDVTYTGTVDEEGEISGTMDIGGGFVTGTFTAVRVDGAAIQADPPPTRLNPVFAPMTIRPEITNRSEVQEALAREYPRALRRAGIGGQVVVWFFISETGRVLDTRVARTSGREELDAAALEVADVFRFAPAMNRDERVRVWIQMPITFRAIRRRE